MVLSILFIAICGRVTPEPVVAADQPPVAPGQPAAAADPTQSPAGLEIARLRGEVAPTSLDQLNAGLFFLVRQYDLPELFALLKDATPERVIARAEVEEHLHRLRRARLALELYYGGADGAGAATEGLSELEIIEHAARLR